MASPIRSKSLHPTTLTRTTVLGATDCSTCTTLSMSGASGGRPRPHLVRGPPERPAPSKKWLSCLCLDVLLKRHQLAPPRGGHSWIHGARRCRYSSSSSTSGGGSDACTSRQDLPLLTLPHTESVAESITLVPAKPAATSVSVQIELRLMMPE